MWEAIVAFAGLQVFILLGIGIFFLVVWLFQYLWNTTMPEVFGVKVITYWQSLRLLILALILFAGGRAS